SHRRADNRSRVRRSGRGLHGRIAARRKRPVHHRDGNEDAVYWPGIMMSDITPRAQRTHESKEAGMIGRWKLVLIVAAVITGCAMIVVTAQQPPPAGGPAPVQGASYTVQQAERGRVAYVSNCSGCHGP